MFVLYNLQHIYSQIRRLPSFTTKVRKYDQNPPVLKVSKTYFSEVPEVEFKDKNSHVSKNRLKQIFKKLYW